MNQSNLAAQIGTLTHIVDRMEQMHELLRGEQHLASFAGYLGDEINVLHAVIDALNAFYDSTEGAVTTGAIWKAMLATEESR